MTGVCVRACMCTCIIIIGALINKKYNVHTFTVNFLCYINIESLFSSNTSPTKNEFNSLPWRRFRGRGIMDITHHCVPGTPATKGVVCYFADSQLNKTRHNPVTPEQKFSRFYCLNIQVKYKLQLLFINLFGSYVVIFVIIYTHSKSAKAGNCAISVGNEGEGRWSGEKIGTVWHHDINEKLMNMVGKLKRKRVIGSIVWSKRKDHKDGVRRSVVDCCIPRRVFLLCQTIDLWSNVGMPFDSLLNWFDLYYRFSRRWRLVIEALMSLRMLEISARLCFGTYGNEM